MPRPSAVLAARTLWTLGVAAAVLAGRAGALPVVPSPRWGINGHPFSQSPYFDIPLEQQLDLLAELGTGWYRFDLDENALRAETARLDDLLAGATRRGIRLLPILMSSPSCRTPGATPDQVHRAAREFGRAVAGRYHGRITHWELENELDFVAMIRKGERDRRGQLWNWDAPDGSVAENFQEARYQLAKAEIQGLSEGIKEADPTARTIVDTSGWLHTGFVTRLVTEDHVPFDVLAWHWYSEMGDITRVQGRIDLLGRLREFGKPVWITETSRRDGSQGGGEPALATFLTTTVAAMGANPGIGPIFYYELLDEPYSGDDTRYGLLAVAHDRQNRWRVASRKAAFESYRAIIARSP